MTDAASCALANQLFDLACCRDHVVHVAGEGLRLLGRLREVPKHGGHTGGAEPQEVEADVLYSENAGLQVSRHLSSADLELAERLALLLEQCEAADALRVVRLARDRRDPL